MPSNLNSPLLHFVLVATALTITFIVFVIWSFLYCIVFVFGRITAWSKRYFVWWANDQVTWKSSFFSNFVIKFLLCIIMCLPQVCWLDVSSLPSWHPQNTNCVERRERGRCKLLTTSSGAGSAARTILRRIFDLVLRDQKICSTQHAASSIGSYWITLGFLFIFLVGSIGDHLRPVEQNRERSALLCLG